ncbi:MAG: hypothetical protein IH626_13590, partial [Rhodospirillales bacterium]|nr:hypothetical protein [Rhodospirillales bacterium]
MAARFGSARTSVPAYTRQFQTLGPTADLLRLDVKPKFEPDDGGLVPTIFGALNDLVRTAVAPMPKKADKAVATPPAPTTVLFPEPEPDEPSIIQPTDPPQYPGGKIPRPSGRRPVPGATPLPYYPPSRRRPDQTWPDARPLPWRPDDSEARPVLFAEESDPALALNRALETAYFAGKDVEIGKLGERIYADNAADLDGFNEGWANVETALLGSLAEPWRPIAKAELDRKRDLYIRRIGTNIRTEVEDETNTTLRTAADTYFQRAAAALHDGDAAESAENARKFRAALDARTDLAADEKDEIRLDFETMAATRTVMGEADRARKDGGLDAAARVIEDFAEGGGPTVADGQRQPILKILKAHHADAQAAERAAQAEAATKAKVESAKRLTAVEKSIGENKYGMADLERDTQAGMFAEAPDASARLSAAIETARKDRHAKT